VLPRRAAAQPDGPPPDREAIETWLVTRIARVLDKHPDEIDVREPFASFGLDSRTAVSLSGELERWLRRRLSPTLIWDHPTIELVAQHLSESTGDEAELPAEIDEASIPGLTISSHGESTV
jgi:acyl carrier protein